MKKIRIGNDIRVEWTLLRNGEAESLEGRDISVSLVNDVSRTSVPVTVLVHENVVYVTYYGKDQNATGTHSLVVVENAGKEDMHTLDHAEVFLMVDRSYKTTCGHDEEECSNINTVVTVELTDDLAYAKDGKSAYEIAVMYGYEGTEAEFAQGLIDAQYAKGIADQAKDIATAAAAKVDQWANVWKIDTIMPLPSLGAYDGRSGVYLDAVFNEQSYDGSAWTNGIAPQIHQALWNGTTDVDTLLIYLDTVEGVVSQHAFAKVVGSFTLSVLFDYDGVNYNIRFDVMAHHASVIATKLSHLVANEELVETIESVDEDIRDIESSLSDLTIQVGGKQDILTAGTGIAIDGNVISSTLDTTVFKVVDALPVVPVTLEGYLSGSSFYGSTMINENGDPVPSELAQMIRYDVEEGHDVISPIASSPLSTDSAYSIAFYSGTPSSNTFISGLSEGTFPNYTKIPDGATKVCIVYPLNVNPTMSIRYGTYQDPEPKIYVVKDTDSEDEENKYVEWIWIDKDWEKVGEFKADTDLSSLIDKLYPTTLTLPTFGNLNYNIHANNERGYTLDLSSSQSDWKNFIKQWGVDVRGGYHGRYIFYVSQTGVGRIVVADGYLNVDSYGDDYIYVLNFSWEGTNVTIICRHITQTDTVTLYSAEAILPAQLVSYDDVNSSSDINVVKQGKQLSMTLGPSVTQRFNSLDSEINNLQDQINNKQNKLTAGEGIVIHDNIIESTVDTSLFVWTDRLPHQYSVGDHPTLLGTSVGKVFSNDYRIVNTDNQDLKICSYDMRGVGSIQFSSYFSGGIDASNYSAFLAIFYDANNTAVDVLQFGNYNGTTIGVPRAADTFKLLTIVEDTPVVTVESALPVSIDEQKIYVVPNPDSTSEDNMFTEYVYHGNDQWEKIGEFNGGGADLTNYYTKAQTDSLLNAKQNTLTAGTGISIDNNVISATGGGGGVEEIETQLYINLGDYADGEYENSELPLGSANAGWINGIAPELDGGVYLIHVGIDTYGAGGGTKPVLAHADVANSDVTLTFELDGVYFEVVFTTGTTKTGTVTAYKPSHLVANEENKFYDTGLYLDELVPSISSSAYEKLSALRMVNAYDKMLLVRGFNTVQGAGTYAVATVKNWGSTFEFYVDDNGTTVYVQGDSQDNWTITRTTPYVKLSGGIPSTDLSSAVQTSLGKADSALQEETLVEVTYDTTTAAQIDALLTDGKIPYLIEDFPYYEKGVVCFFVEKAFYGEAHASNSYVFAGGKGDKCYVATLNLTTGSWSKNTTSLQSMAYFAQNSMSGDTTSIYKYPSTKAVADYAEAKTNKVTSLSSSSTDTQYPSAACVYGLLGDIDSLCDDILGDIDAELDVLNGEVI